MQSCLVIDVIGSSCNVLWVVVINGSNHIIFVIIFFKVKKLSRVVVSSISDKSFINISCMVIIKKGLSRCKNTKLLLVILIVVFSVFLIIKVTVTSFKLCLKNKW